MRSYRWVQILRERDTREGRPAEDTGRQWPSAGLGEKPQEKPNLQHLDLGFSACKTMRKSISVVAATQSGTLFRQPKQTETLGNLTFENKEWH